jgi:hypothetical protein
MHTFLVLLLVTSPLYKISVLQYGVGSCANAYTEKLHRIQGKAILSYSTGIYFSLSSPSLSAHHLSIWVAQDYHCIHNAYALILLRPRLRKQYYQIRWNLSVPYNNTFLCNMWYCWLRYSINPIINLYNVYNYAQISVTNDQLGTKGNEERTSKLES